MTLPSEPTFAERLAERLAAKPVVNQPHVCGNCRNPWTKYGRPDCPGAKR